MRKILLTVLGVLGFFWIQQIHAQIPQFTQYMFNNYITNPAIAGTYNYFQIRMNERIQWVGLEDAPQTTSISFFGPTSKRDMGWGSYLFMDVTGPTSRMGIMGSYAYNMSLNEDFRISGGISFGFLQYKVDYSKLNLGENQNTQDPVIFNTAQSTFTPDASIGVYIYNSLYYLGVSANQLFGQKLNLYYDPTNGVNRLKQHILVSGGYRYIINRYYEVEPGILLKYMFGSPFQFEINGKVTYRGQMWGGLSYRFKDAFSILLGYNYKKRYIFGYSYDYSYTGLRKYQTGTHEVMVGYLFDKLK